jgi:hypothetical protein
MLRGLLEIVELGQRLDAALGLPRRSAAIRRVDDVGIARADDRTRRRPQRP